MDRAEKAEGMVAALRETLESSPILTREPGEFGREWKPDDHVGTTFGHWDAWYMRRNAVLRDTAQTAALYRERLLVEARNATCYGCDQGWPFFDRAPSLSDDYHKTPEGEGFRCAAAAIRALLPPEKP